MIYEIRTYQIEPGSLAEVEKRFAEAYDYRKKYSELTGFFHTEIGPLNEIVHIWAYEDLADRERRREALIADPKWLAVLPRIQSHIEMMENKIMKPAPFSPAA